MAGVSSGVMDARRGVLSFFYADWVFYARGWVGARLKYQKCAGKQRLLRVLLELNLRLNLKKHSVLAQLKNIFDASISAVTWSLLGRKCALFFTCPMNVTHAVSHTCVYM